MIFAVLAGCDDDDGAKLLGGGPGSSQEEDLAVSTDGFCVPKGGATLLGEPSWNSGVAQAKIDTDGNPAMSGRDPTWSPETTGQVNGHAVNSTGYAYVVMSRDQLNGSGVSMGDWATVTNPATGKSTYARVMDIGPPGGVGEISQRAASAIGIQYLSDSATVGDPSVVVQVYAGTASILGDCNPLANS